MQEGQRQNPTEVPQVAVRTDRCPSLYVLGTGARGWAIKSLIRGFGLPGSKKSFSLC